MDVFALLLYGFSLRRLHQTAAAFVERAHSLVWDDFALTSSYK